MKRMIFLLFVTMLLTACDGSIDPDDPVLDLSREASLFEELSVDYGDGYSNMTTPIEFNEARVSSVKIDSSKTISLKKKVLRHKSELIEYVCEGSAELEDDDFDEVLKLIDRAELATYDPFDNGEEIACPALYFGWYELTYKRSDGKTNHFYNVNECPLSDDVLKLLNTVSDLAHEYVECEESDLVEVEPREDPAVSDDVNDPEE